MSSQWLNFNQISRFGRCSSKTLWVYVRLSQLTFHLSWEAIFYSEILQFGYKVILRRGNVSQRGWIGVNNIPPRNSLLHQPCYIWNYSLLVVGISTSSDDSLLNLLVICDLTLALRFELLLDVWKSFLVWRHHIGLATKCCVKLIFLHLHIQCSW